LSEVFKRFNLLRSPSLLQGMCGCAVIWFPYKLTGLSASRRTYTIRWKIQVDTAVFLCIMYTAMWGCKLNLFTHLHLEDQ